MDDVIEIIPIRPEYYTDAVAIFNQGFLPKFRIVTDSEELRQSFADDFELIVKHSVDKDFLAVLGDRVLGYLSILYWGQRDNRNYPIHSTLKLISRYGLGGVFRAMLMDIIFITDSLKMNPILIVLLCRLMPGVWGSAPDRWNLLSGSVSR